LARRSLSVFPLFLLKLKLSNDNFLKSWIDKFPCVVFDENAQEMYCKYCRKFPHLSDRKDALTRGTKNLRIHGLKLHDKYQEHLLCVKHWIKELDESNDNFLKSCQHKHTIDQCYSDA
jgi:hypothetical protein